MSGGFLNGSVHITHTTATTLHLKLLDCLLSISEEEGGGGRPEEKKKEEDKEKGQMKVWLL